MPSLLFKYLVISTALMSALTVLAGEADIYGGWARQGSGDSEEYVFYRSKEFAVSLQPDPDLPVRKMFYSGVFEFGEKTCSTTITNSKGEVVRKQYGNLWLVFSTSRCCLHAYRVGSGLAVDRIDPGNTDHAMCQSMLLKPVSAGKNTTIRR